MSYSRLGRRWLAPRLYSSEPRRRSQAAFMTTAPSVTPRLRPSPALFGVEFSRAAIEYASHRLRRRPSNDQGNGHPVNIFPGLGADGRSVWRLRNYLRASGHDANDWGRGLNRGPRGDGDVDTWLHGLATKVVQRIGTSAKPATLIGWILGGLYAREVGKLAVAWVRQVVIMGTPFNSDADHSNVGWLFRALNGSSTAIDSTMSRRLRRPPAIPTTSIYSRSNVIVAWQTCLHARTGPQVEDIEVRSSHVGMVWNSQVLLVIADRLAQPLGRWQQFVPTR